MIGFLRPYLGEYSVHFCHELYNYISSPHNITSYDCYVHYFNTSGQRLLNGHGLIVK